MIFNDNNGNPRPFVDYRDLEEEIKNIKFGSYTQDDKLHAIWEQIFQRNAGKRRHAEQNALRACRLVFAAFHPLTYSQLAEAVSVEDPESANYFHPNTERQISEEHIRSLTQNFLTEDETGWLHFAHMSAVDYLRATEQSMSQVGFSLLECHTEMMQLCLFFVRSLPGCSVRSQEAVAQILEPPRGVKRATWPGPFLHYSYWHWQAHCAAVALLSDHKDVTNSQLVDKILANDEWSEALRTWSDIVSQYDPRDYAGRPVTGFKLCRILFTTIAPLPGLFMASAFGLPHLLKYLKEHAIYRSRNVLLQRIHGSLCVISAVNPINHDYFRELVCTKASIPEQRTATQEPSDSALLIQSLIQLGACVDLRDKTGGTPAMRLSNLVSNAHDDSMCEIYDVLFNQGGNIGAWNMYGETVLHKARETWSTARVSRLIDLGADVDFRIAGGQTALEATVPYRSCATFRHLLESGADHRAAFRDSTVWHVVSRFEYSAELAAQIESATGGVRSNDKTGWTPLMQAAFYGDRDWVQYFLCERPDHNPESETERNRKLAFAVVMGEFQATRPSRPWSLAKLELFGYLQLQGVSFNVADEHGTTPLMIAASRCDVVSVECLVRLNQGVHAVDCEGRTALHYTSFIHPHMRAYLPNKPPDLGMRDHITAVMKQNCQYIRDTLISAGAAKSRKDHQGYTADDLLELSLSYHEAQHDYRLRQSKAVKAPKSTESSRHRTPDVGGNLQRSEDQDPTPPSLPDALSFQAKLVKRFYDSPFARGENVFRYRLPWTILPLDREDENFRSLFETAMANVRAGQFSPLGYYDPIARPSMRSYVR